MKKASLALARACYLLVVVFTTAFGVVGAFQMVKAASMDFAVLFLALVAAAFLILSGGALRRRWRGQALLPDPMGSREWKYVVLMTCAGAFAHLLVVSFCLAIYQYLYVFPDREREGGPLAAIAVLAMFFYLLALLMGEFGIRHDKRLTQARTNPSSGRTDELSGNTLESSAADDTPR
jgi:hypothetical protein